MYAGNAAERFMMNKLFIGDSLEVLQDEIPDNYVDLIYLDPPFNTGRDFGDFNDDWSDGLYSYESTAIIAAEEIHGSAMASYLSYMGLRLVEMERVLKEKGSIYYHCDKTAIHYVKMLMDEIFGVDRFRNEIIWCYAPSGNPPKRGFHKKHDTILYYATESGIWNPAFTDMDKKTRKTYNKQDEDGRWYAVHHGGRITYLDDIPGRPVPDWWTDIPSFGNAGQSKERTGYPTQKPLKLLTRIIKASSNRKQIVLDPFCGAGTTCVAAKQLSRRYIGIDLNPEAIQITEERLKSASPTG